MANVDRICRSRITVICCWAYYHIPITMMHCILLPNCTGASQGQANNGSKKAVFTCDKHVFCHRFQAACGLIAVPSALCTMQDSKSLWGRFRTAWAQRGHSAHTAPIITVIIQVTTLKTTHLRNHAQSIQNSKIQTSDAMGPRDLNSAPYSPVHCSSHSMTSFQSSELTELLVVENSQLFAQRTVRPL